MADQNEIHRGRLFVGCIIALVATAFGFGVRAAMLDEWRIQFNLSQEQVGYLQGAGLYPFAISIILFSLIVDRIGYGISMVVAFSLHVVSTLIAIFAQNFETLYLGTFLFALGNGTVEAVINPVTATLFPKNKTHYLSILHAGWPGGNVLGGLLAIGVSFIDPESLPGKLWQWQMALILLPTAVYGLLLAGQKFPVQERVAAGVSYKEMLQEFGTASCYLACLLLVAGFNQILLVVKVPSLGLVEQAVIALIPTALFGAYVKTFGRPMFVFLLIVMNLLATTELGTDSWISDIMRSVLASPTQGHLFLMWTMAIMFVLRFFAGPIVHVISPLGLLAVSSAMASLGLLWLAQIQSVGILIVAATFYGLGKTFFWPATLGVVSEQYPRGGALTLNAIAGIGMISVGTIGNPAIGYLADQAFAEKIKDDVVLSEKVLVDETGLFGTSKRLDAAKQTAINDEIAGIRRQAAEELQKQHDRRPTDAEIEKALADDPRGGLLVQQRDKINHALREAKQENLAKISILPSIMFVCYVILIAYFQSKGGYRAQVLTGHAAEDEEFTGGVQAPVE
jgi:MFS family permease